MSERDSRVLFTFALCALAVVARRADAGTLPPSSGVYIADCRRHGVPIPPTWGASGWQNRGVLTNEIVDGNLEAQVYTYASSSPVGSCIALPRSSGNIIQLLDIICLGQASSVACYWESPPTMSYLRGTQVPISELLGAPQLAGLVGPCTACHAGPNPFILHPGTALGSPNLDDVVLRGDDWYVPLVSDSWPQNDGPSDILSDLPGGELCVTCHSDTGAAGPFPRLSSDVFEFCNTVVRGALQKTMPPGNVGAADEPLLSALIEECGKRPVERLRQWGEAGDVPVPADYDGDGRSDFAVWRPSSGDWFVIDSSTGADHSQQWGQEGDVPVPGDYDGDGRADFAVWRPGGGDWFVIHSSSGADASAQWGQAGDIPVPGDYDDDGRTDLAVWRPSNGRWFVIDSSTGVDWSQPLGKNGDVPVPGDYDGDGYADLATWDPSDGIWLVWQSFSATTLSMQWGQSGDIPVAADYDEDGLTDVAVWRPSDPTWYVIDSSSGADRAAAWGAAGDVPAPADYDDDGRANVAVWSPSNGSWQVVY